MGSSYSKSDAARDTNSSRSDVSGAWHNARNDSVGSGRLEGRSEKKERATRDTNWYTGKTWNKRTQEWE